MTIPLLNYLFATGNRSFGHARVSLRTLKQYGGKSAYEARAHCKLLAPRLPLVQWGYRMVHGLQVTPPTAHVSTSCCSSPGENVRHKADGVVGTTGRV